MSKKDQIQSAQVPAENTTFNNPDDFVVTFGAGQRLENCYSRIPKPKEGPNSYDAARKRVVQEYGAKWAFIYDNEEAAGVERFDLIRLSFGTPNK